VPYHRFAEMIGLAGIYVDDPDHIGPAWEEALASRIPTVLEVKTDPEVPPLPPHITFEQAKHFMFATAKGDPNLVDMVKGSVKQGMASLTGGE
jgi:pyruvate dehydrogenase (quinone)